MLLQPTQRKGKQTTKTAATDYRLAHASIILGVRVATHQKAICHVVERLHNINLATQCFATSKNDCCEHLTSASVMQSLLLADVLFIVCGIVTSNGQNAASGN